MSLQPGSSQAFIFALCVVPNLHITCLLILMLLSLWLTLILMSMSPFYNVVESMVDVTFALQHREAGHFQQASFLRSAGNT